MRIIGLCGRSGSGKGYVCERFWRLGIPCIDTDAVYRELTAPGAEMSELTRELAGTFGSAVVRPDNSLDRSVLADIVFGGADKSALESLNAISHKHILARTDELLAQYERQGMSLAVVDAPVLFESGYDAKCDITVCVTAPEEKRIRRIMRRDGIDEDSARRRLAAQKDDSELAVLCDEIIVNDGDDAALDAQLDRIIRSVLKDEGRKA